MEKREEEFENLSEQLSEAAEQLLGRFVGRKFDASAIEEVADEIELLQLIHGPATPA